LREADGKGNGAKFKGMNQVFKFPTNKLDVSIEEQCSINKDFLNVSTNHSLLMPTPPKLINMLSVQSQPLIKPEKTNLKESQQQEPLFKSMMKSKIKAKTETMIDTAIISQSRVMEDSSLAKVMMKSKNVVMKNDPAKMDHNMNKKRDSQKFGADVVEDLFTSIYQNRLVQVDLERRIDNNVDRFLR